MPVLVLFQWKGNPDELLAAYDRELQHPVAKQQRRRISHTCARADDGMVIAPRACVGNAREGPRVPRLMYPSRTCGPLSVLRDIQRPAALDHHSQ